MPKTKVSNTIPGFPTYKVKYKDIFDFKEFYTAMQEWLLEHDWMDTEDKQSGKDHWETFYGERLGQDGSKEIWIRWRMLKKAPQAAFLTYYLDFDYHCLGLSGAEVVKEGRKMKVHKGEMELEVRGLIEEVYKKKFEEDRFLNEVKELFAKRIYRKTIDQRKKEFYQEAYELQNYMKQWLKLKRYLPYEEVKSFFPSQAWPSHLKEE